MDSFNWGTSPEWFQNIITKEIFQERIYEKFFEVEEGDIVLDVGASIGPFAYSILHKNPKHIFCIEPSFDEFPTLAWNTRYGNVTCINKGISKVDDKVTSLTVYGSEGNATEIYGISFKNFIDLYNIKQIDFLKTDCEEGEYDIFTPENLIWIKQNVKKIAGEWHLGNPESKQKFKEFRDVYLRVFPKHEIYSTDGINVKWDLWNEHFIEYYEQVIIYINNK